MARINRYLDMVPASFILGFDNLLVKNAMKNLDPAKAKTTSMMLVEAAEEDKAKEAGDKGGGAAGSSGSNNKKRKRAQSPSAPAVTVQPASGEAQPSSRAELHAKLERRLAELREERRKHQSALDKEKAQALRKAREAGEVPWPSQKVTGGASTSVKGAPNAKAKELHAQGKEVAVQRKASIGIKEPEASTASELDLDSVEVGHLSFTPRATELPFDATINRKGTKQKRLRAELRKMERVEEKLQKAEERGDGDEKRRSIGMQKALLRAQGQKVHDNSQKLRKAQKVHEVKKKKGREKQEQLKEEVSRQQEERQAKRKENLQRRAANKKKNKRRSGFEGNRDGFLNSEA